jgi:hypothetical protein
MKGSAMSDYDMSIHHNPDAKAWAVIAKAKAKAERDAAYERAAVVAANFKHADPVDDKRDDGSGSFGLGVDVASDSIAAAIRKLKEQHHD